MPMPRAPSVRWVTGLPLPVPAVPGGFGIEVAFEDETGTFVALADDGRFARVLLARLAGGTTEHRGLLALTVQRDAIRLPPGAGLDNRDVEARWQRERARLAELGGRGAAVLVATGAHGGVVDPVALDRRTGRLFRLAGPGSWQPLRTCRDDAVLREARLEPWSTTTTRYLRDPGDPNGPFYAVAAATGGAAAGGGAGVDPTRVRDRAALFADIVAAWAAATDAERADVAARLPDLAAVLADLRADEIEQRIVPLVCHEAFVLATELHELHFDEFCDLAGGAPFAAAVGNGGALGRAVATAELAARLDGPQQWLAVPWTAGGDVVTLAGDARQVRRLAIEAAFLKLHAFGAACRGLALYHAQLGEPHLGVAAEHVMLRACHAAGAPVPVRWGFAVAWTEVAAGVPRQLEGRGQERAAGLCQPTLDGSRLYRAPALDVAANVVELAVRVAAAPILAGDAVVGLRCELPASKDRLHGVAVGDVVRLAPEAPLPALGPMPLLATVTALQRQGAIAEFRPDAGAATPLPGSPFVFAATATFHRRLRPSVDLFSLGMLLSRALLVHDERDLATVRETWERLLDRLDLQCASQTSLDGTRVASVMRGLLDAERGQLDSASVLWCKELRATVSSPLPPVLWRELLLTIARLLCRLDGFAFASPRTELAGEAVEAPLRRIVNHVDALLAALRIELTEQNVRREEIASVAEAMLAELDAAGRPGGSA